MLKSKLHYHTLKVVLITSVLWLLFVAAIVVYFSELCQRGPSSAGVDVEPSLSADTKVRNAAAQRSHRTSRTRRTTKQGLIRRIMNSFNVDGPGEQGKAVYLTGEEETRGKELFGLNQFNLVVSEKIALNRSLPDVRLPQCRSVQYPSADSLPRTSIIIVFHNEAWTTLLRSIYSIINRSPPEVLEEIILVDDMSEDKFEHLKEPLEQEVKKFDVPVRLFRMPSRSGLIRARLKGAEEAKGEILLFLDAHIETTEGWLEPLLARVAEDRTRVVSPIIDVISDDTFEYVTASDMTWGGFNWKLNFRWYTAPNRELVRRHHDRTLPLQTPTIAGGLFAIDKKFFYEMGSYDEGQDVWGGENLELSFRIWQCGGSLEIVTCSHVGHVFRKSTPYKFPGGTATVINHNSRRVAEVWMDEYKEFFYSMNVNAKSVQLGDITERMTLKKKLGCKSFRWYLENVYPESIIPINFLSLGEVKNPKTGKCLDTYSRKAGEHVSTAMCHSYGGNQAWSYTEKHEIQNDELCLEVSDSHSPVRMASCNRRGSGGQSWRFNSDTGLVESLYLEEMCLSAYSDPNQSDYVKVFPCDASDQAQHWTLAGFKSNH